MNIIPPPLRQPLVEGLPLRYAGKVRQVFDLPDPEQKLIVVTDQISAFDFVFPCLIPGKGAVLHHLTSLWKNRLRKTNWNFRNDLLANYDNITSSLPEGVKFDHDLMERSSIVQWFKNRLPVEAIVRGYLLGSAWREYQKNPRDVYGYNLPDGMKKGQKLELPIFTPTTKAESGHDMPMSCEEVRNKYGKDIEVASLHAFHEATSLLPDSVIIGDTKLEFARSEFGDLVIVDEAFTPDSSRYMLRSEWESALDEGRDPKSWDKEIFRDGVRHLVTGLDPSKEEDVQKIWDCQVPETLIKATGDRYREINQIILDSYV